MKHIKAPEEVVVYRKMKCNCSCDIDFSNACERCPNNKWHPFGCYETIENHEMERMPSTKEMAKNITKSSIQELSAIFQGKEPVTQEEKNKRMDICKSCIFFEEKSERCKKCGCYLMIKTAWRSQVCPIGKW